MVNRNNGGLAYAAAGFVAGVIGFALGKLGSGRRAFRIRAAIPDSDGEKPTVSDASSRSYDWSKHRNPPPVEHLLPSSEVWLDLLPSAAFPGALATHYPRIVNLIAMLWSHRIGCSAYFDELIIDRRGGRQGFPAAVKRDLLVLRDFWHSRGLRQLQ
jgi:hypothetical protein